MNRDSHRNDWQDPVVGAERGWSARPKLVAQRGPVTSIEVIAKRSFPAHESSPGVLQRFTRCLETAFWEIPPALSPSVYQRICSGNPKFWPSDGHDWPIMMPAWI